MSDKDVKIQAKIDKEQQIRVLRNIELETQQRETAPNIDLAYREYLEVVGAKIINSIAPSQDRKTMGEAVTKVINVMMTDYNGTIPMNQVLSGMDKDFLPQPGMLAYWAERKESQKIENMVDAPTPEDANGKKLRQEDVAGKYVLTYYTPMAQSWGQRTTDNITDTSNKHWYSHCKSSVYDENGKPIATSNPELKYNDTEHDATVYVPADSKSYIIDYKSMGLSEQDIHEGFLYQCEGINIMDPAMQSAIFKMKEAGLAQEDIIRLYKDGSVNFSDSQNIAKIEQHLKQGGKKDGLMSLDLTKSDNSYKYNLQDYSCAIRPTAPILYATSAKINRENLSQAEADKLRKDIGLHNIYDIENYAKVNKDFYDGYESSMFEKFKEAVEKEYEEFKNNPRQKIKGAINSASEMMSWLSAKTQLYIPEARDVIASTTNKEIAQNQSNEPNVNRFRLNKRERA